MRPLITFCLILLCYYTGAVKITFKVDLASEPFISYQGVFLQLSSDSSLYQLLSTGSKSYSVEHEFPAISSISYRFLNGKDVVENIEGDCASDGWRTQNLPGSDTVLSTVCFGFCASCADSSYNNHYYFVQWTLASSFAEDTFPSTLSSIINFPADSISVYSVSNDSDTVVQFKIFSSSGHQAYKAVETLKDLYHSASHSLTKEYTITKMEVNGEDQPVFYADAKGTRSGVSVGSIVVVILVGGLILSSVVIVFVARQRRKASKQQEQDYRSSLQLASLQKRQSQMQEPVTEYANAHPEAHPPALNDNTANNHPPMPFPPQPENYQYAPPVQPTNYMPPPMPYPPTNVPPPVMQQYPPVDPHYPPPQQMPYFPPTTQDPVQNVSPIPPPQPTYIQPTQ